MPDELPADPALVKQLLPEALARQAQTAAMVQAHNAHIVDLKEQIKLLLNRLFGRKSEQAVESSTPQPALFNEPESESMPSVDDVAVNAASPA